MITALFVVSIVLLVMVATMIVYMGRIERKRVAECREKSEMFFKACDALVAFTAELSKVTNDVLNNKR